MITTWILVFLAMIGATLLASVATFLLVFIEKPIQWGGKDLAEWKALGVEAPGERLPALSFLSGMIGTTITRGFAYVAGAWVFVVRNADPSIIPMVLYALFFLPMDLARIRVFSGNSGQPKEIGYFCGSIVAFALFLWMHNANFYELLHAGH